GALSPDRSRSNPKSNPDPSPEYDTSPIMPAIRTNAPTTTVNMDSSATITLPTIKYYTHFYLNDFGLG
ncbi:MAG: hypothetical protein KAI18_02920, partial [Candidatus Aenigmarchaeota archaeon]|nr:hypothetical protein [Candidatus Aenigmarchaeota archaeon]